MDWGIYATLAGFATFKFMFTPLAGWVAELTFLETYLCTCAGGLASSAIFYFSANYFMQRAAARYRKKLQKSLETGKPFKKKKNFTRLNKFIVRIKRSIGMIGISFWAPLFLSIPGGSIVTAKFYGKKKMTYPLIVIGVFMNAGVITSLVYLFQ